MYKYLENFSLKNIILFFVILFSSLIFSVILIFLSINVKKNSLDDSKAIVDSYTKKNAVALEGIFNEVMSITRTLANAFIENKDDNLQSLNPVSEKILKNTLINNPEFISVWLDWEIKAIKPDYKKKNGRVGSAIYRINGNFTSYRDIRDTTDLEIKGGYYDIKKSKKEIMGEPYYDQYTEDLAGILMVSPSVPIIAKDQFIGMVGVDLSMERIRKIIKTVKPYDISKAYLISPNNIIVAHTDNEYYDKNLFDVKNEQKDSYEQATKEVMQQKPYAAQMRTKDGKEEYVSFVPVVIGKDNEIWTLVTETPTSIVTEKSNKLFVLTIGIGVLGIVIFSMVIYFVLNKVTKKLIQTINLSEQISNGDLSQRINISGENEIGRLALSMNKMTEKLKNTISEISASYNHINQSSSEITQFSDELSNGSSAQATSVEQVMAQIEEIISNIQANTDNAKQTELISAKALEGIKNGSNSANETAKSINKIAEKISLIDEISKQTNILALNAAVEAARAGTHGKGFSVVATEVKKLAEMAQMATEQINELSSNGVSLSDQSEKELMNLIPDIEKTASLINEITTANIEQSNGATHVQNAVQNLNTIAQKNTELSENLENKADNLSEEADRLNEIIKYFKI
ncbi:MAG: methyl-accepting chemotaxis protein [Bacteroidota bacterium]